MLATYIQVEITLFVKDTCSAIYMLSKTGKKNNGEIFHIEIIKTYKIQYIINKIKTLMDLKQKIKTNKLRVRPKNGEVDILRCDNKKIKNTVGWKAEFSFEKGLIETIDWFRKIKIDLFQFIQYLTLSKQFNEKNKFDRGNGYLNEKSISFK